MKELFLKDIIECTGGRIIHGSDEHIVRNIVVLPPNLKEDGLLFNIYKRKDVDFKQCSNYKSCSIVTENTLDYTELGENIAIIKVEDIEEAYKGFISYYRGLFDIPVIGVTGTCGKTTVKEMVKYILGHKYKLQCTHMSSNALSLNLQYLLGIDESTQAAVFEMGVAYPGNVRTSCRYFQPQIGVITNIGIDHLQGCKTLENYIKAKSEMLEGLGNKGTLILNADDENIAKIDLSNYQGKIIYFGIGEKVDFRAIKIDYAKEGMKFVMQYQGINYELFIAGHGEHNVYNAMAALAVAVVMGFSLDEAGNIMRSFKQVTRHMQIRKGIRQSTIIDDTWSSNYPSTKVAVKALSEIATDGKAIAVLGTMVLLDQYSVEYHEKIGTQIVEQGIDMLIVIGEEAGIMARKALELGMKSDNVYVCSSVDEISGILDQRIQTGDVILVKDNHDILREVVKHISLGD